MKKRLWILALLILAFAGLFRWAYQGSLEQAQVGQADPSIEGRYGTYSYTVDGRRGDKEQNAVFRPALAADDGTVVGALRQVARTIFSELLIDNVQPAVETIDERQYITFTTTDGKIFFQLFKDEAGNVGSARFWRETIKSVY